MLYILTYLTPCRGPDLSSWKLSPLNKFFLLFTAGCILVALPVLALLLDVELILAVELAMDLAVAVGQTPPLLTSTRVLRMVLEQGLGCGTPLASSRRPKMGGRAGWCSVLQGWCKKLVLTGWWIAVFSATTIGQRKLPHSAICSDYFFTGIS